MKTTLKKLTTVTLILIMALAVLTGCGGEAKDEQKPLILVQ